MASTKNYRKKSGRRKPINKEKKQERSKESLLYEYRYELGFVFASVFSLLMFLSNLGIVGVVGKGIKNVNFGLFGIFAWLSPLFLFVSITLWIANRNSLKVKIKLWLSFLIFIIFSAIAELISYPSIASMTYKSLYFSSADKKNGGGFLGGLIAKFLAGGMGLIGTYIILIALLVIIFIFLTGRVFVNPIKRRAVETRDHLIDLKNEKIEDARKRAEIKSEIRREERQYKKEERERLREEKRLKFQEIKFDALKSYKEQKEVVKEETKEVEISSASEEEILELQSLMERQERLLKEIRKKGKKAVELKEIGSKDKADLTNLIQDESSNEEGEDGVYKQLLESKFGKLEREDLKISTSSETPTHKMGGLSWNPVRQDEDFPFEAEVQLSKEEERGIGKPSWEEIEEDVLEGTFKEESVVEKAQLVEVFKEGIETPLQKVEDRKEPVPLEEETGTAEAIISEVEIGLEGERGFREEPDVEGEASPCEDDNDEYEQYLEENNFEEAMISELLKKEEEKEKAEEVQTLEEKVYVFPPIELLLKSVSKEEGVSEEELHETADKLQKTLAAFGVKAKVTDVSCGPSVTRYELQPQIGVKVSRITSLADDIKLNLAAADIRIEAPIPGKAAVGIEVPNKSNTMVYFRDLIENKEFIEHGSMLSFAVGKDIGGQTMVTDIAKMPHLLIAGATGSGKSVCINTLIMSILYKARPDEVKLIMIDPKVVELSCYNGIPHLLLPVVTDPKKAAAALNWAVAEMNRRYTLFAEKGVRNIKGYNKVIGNNNPNWLPQIVIIVDELADLMMVSSKEVEEAICRIAQLARAAGIHLVIATQRPSVNVITGLIKANIPSRIAFAVSSQVDSRTILDGAGAEKLLGKGDMLFFPSGYPKPVRVQGAFVSDNEVADVVDFIKEHNGNEHKGEDITEAVNQVAAAETIKEIATKPQADENDDYDEYFDEAGMFIIEKQKASIGMLQRVYRIGFNRAARIMDQLAEAGVVSDEDGTRGRKILMTKEEFSAFLNLKHGEVEPEIEVSEDDV